MRFNRASSILSFSISTSRDSKVDRTASKAARCSMTSRCKLSMSLGSGRLGMPLSVRRTAPHYFN